MLRAQDLKGLGVALVTPFNEDKTVDFQALEGLVNYVIEGGISYLVVLGTTAETATLSEQEQREVASCVCEVNNGRVPLLIGAGGNNTKVMVDKMKNNNILSKYDGLLIATPYYNKPNQEGLFQHYKVIAEQSSLPILLYNVPGRTGINMTDTTILRLAEAFSNIIGIKEASGNLMQVSRIINKKPAHFEVISGDDALTLPMMSLGAIGVISVLANALPLEMSDLVRCSLNQDCNNARQLHSSLFDLSEAIFEEGNPTGIKALMFEQRLLKNVLRLPLITASENLQNKTKELLKRLS